MSFPDDVPAHSREQLYYFGDDGLLRRNDYTAEVFYGSWTKAAHYCYDHRSFGGLVIPTRRRAMPRRRNGRPLRQVAVVTLAFHEVTLRPRTDAAVLADGTGSAEARPASGSA